MIDFDESETIVRNPKSAMRAVPLWSIKMLALMEELVKIQGDV